MLSDTDLKEFENLPKDRASDETDIGLRAYITRIPEDKLAEYDPDWSDRELIDWDGNFKDDGALMLVCCERDIEPPEFRRVFEEFLEFRKGRQP